MPYPTRICIRFCLGLLLAAPLLVAAQVDHIRHVTTVEGISEYRLDNGLKVLLMPDESRPTATINITYFVGSKHESYGETGMAHLLEHLVFMGTPDHQDTPDSDRSSGPEHWTLSENPVLSIGVVEGEDPFQFHTAASSRLLDDGRLVVVNGGSSEVRFFDKEGRFLESFGGPGEGPGEFRAARQIREMSDGTLRVWDQRLARYSYHAGDGSHLRVEQVEWSRSEPFPGDVWLYGRNLVDSPVAPGSRGPIAEAIRELPPVDSLATVRHVLITEQGRIWSWNEALPHDAPVEVGVWSFGGSRSRSSLSPPDSSCIRSVRTSSSVDTSMNWM